MSTVPRKKNGAATGLILVFNGHTAIRGQSPAAGQRTQNLTILPLGLIHTGLFSALARSTRISTESSRHRRAGWNAAPLAGTEAQLLHNCVGFHGIFFPPHNRSRTVEMK